MKKNDVIIGLSAIASTYLIYGHAPGINFLIFTVLLLTLLYYFNRPVKKLQLWLIYGGAALFASSMVMIVNSSLATFATLFSYALMIGKFVEPASSLIISMLQGAITFFDHNLHIFSRFMNDEEPLSDKRNKNWFKWVAVFCSLIAATAFLFLYADASPLFKNLLAKINFEWFSLGHIIFTIFLLSVFYSIAPLRPYLPMIEWDLKARKKSFHGDVTSSADSIFSIFSGLFIPVLFVLINLMLLFINLLDLDNIFISQILPKHLTLSDFVHNGVWSLVISILLAITVIQLLYQPQNYSPAKSKWIKILLYTWIFQSLLMIASTCARNCWYVEGYGLTYLRIGVFVFLLLSSIGLIWTAIQIKFERSTWQLVSLNMETWFFILVLSSAINWDVRITEFNLSAKKIDRIDWHYLVHLSDANIPTLLKYQNKHRFDLTPLRYDLDDKIDDATSKLWGKSWQSFNFRDQLLIKTLKIKL